MPLQVFQTLEYNEEISRKTQLKQMLMDGRANFTKAVLNSPLNVSYCTLSYLFIAVNIVSGRFFYSLWNKQGLVSRTIKLPDTE
jgi:hypothetical protein